MEEFAVVHFLEGKEGYSEVPKNLLVISENKKECWWPDIKDPNNLIAKSVGPNSRGFKWSKFEVETICSCETIDSASTIAELLMKEHLSSKLDVSFGNDVADVKSQPSPIQSSKNYGIMWFADKLPFKEAKDLEDFDALLKKDEKLQNSFKKHLIKIGGESVTEHLNGILKSVFNDKLAATYWDKEKADTIFKLATMKFIFGVLCNIKNFNTTNTTLENLSLTYFNSVKNNMSISQKTSVKSENK